MDFEVVERIHINRDRCRKVGAFLYDKEVDGLYHESPWPFPVQLGITHGLTKCQVTPMFLNLPFILKGWINQDILLRQIDLLKLAQAGKILMHASCVDDTLIVGLPQAGKTYETYRRVAHGGLLVSEEYTVISGLEASPFRPVMRTCFSRKTLDAAGMVMTAREKAEMAANTLRARLFPFMYEAVIWREIPVSGEVCPKVRRILYGSTGEEVKDWKRLAILCENEFPFMSSEFLQAYALAAGYDLIGIQNTQRELIRRFVDAVYS